MHTHHLGSIHRTLLQPFHHGGSEDPAGLSMISEAPAAVLEPQQEEWPVACRRCTRHPDPQACCSATLSSNQDQPDWFDTVTFVGGFAIIFTIMFVCCVHQFRKQTAESRRRRRLRNQASMPPVPPPEPMIVCVDLNKKLAFPLPAPPTPPSDATPPAEPQRPASEAGSDDDIGETRFDRIMLRVQTIASSAADRADRIVVQPSVSAAQAAGRHMHGWVASASQSLRRTHADGADQSDQNEQNEAESGEVQNNNDGAEPQHASLQLQVPNQNVLEAVVTEEGAESTTASQDSGESSQEEGPTDVEGSQQWFKSLPPRHLPFLAVMPNAEVWMCRPLIPKSTEEVLQPLVRKPSWCYLPHSPKNYSSGARGNTHAMDVAVSSSQDALRLGRGGSEGLDTPTDEGSMGVEAAASRATHNMHAENSGIAPPPEHKEAVPMQPMHGRSAIETITSMPESAKEDIHAVHAKENGCVVEMAEIVLPDPVLLPCASSNSNVHEVHACGSIGKTPSGMRTASSWFTADSGLEQACVVVPTDSSAQEKGLTGCSEEKAQSALTDAVNASQEELAVFPAQMSAVPVQLQEKPNRLKEKMNGLHSRKSSQSDTDLPLEIRGSSSGSSETGASEGGSEGAKARPSSLAMRSSYYFSSLSGCGDPSTSSPASYHGVRTPGTSACIMNAGQSTPDRSSGGASPVGNFAAGVVQESSVSSGVQSANSSPETSVHNARNAPASAFCTPMKAHGVSGSNIMHESHASCSRSESRDHDACAPDTQGAHDSPETTVAVQVDAHVHAAHASGAGPPPMRDTRSMSQRARDWANEPDSDSESESSDEDEELVEGQPLFAYFYKVNLEGTDFEHVLPGTTCMGLQVDEIGQGSSQPSNLLEEPSTSSVC